MKRTALRRNTCCSQDSKILDEQGKLESLKPFLEELDENQGVAANSKQVPSEISDFLQQVGEYYVLPPVDLDDISLFFHEERALQEKSLLAEEEKQRLEGEAMRLEQESKSQQLRQKTRPTTIQVAVAESQTKGENSIYLGKQLDFEQFVGAINRRVQENDLAAQVRQLGEYYIEFEAYATLQSSDPLVPERALR